MNIFDGDAISRADREFLASLDEHPLRQNPLYGTPCPPQPDFGPFDPKDTAQTAARLAFFADVVTWMLANYAYREGAFMSKEAPSRWSTARSSRFADLRGRMAPWALLHSGPRGALKVRSPVEDWMLAKARRSIRREEMRPDQPRPTFEEDGYAIFNRYRPPAHPATGGDLAAFESYFARLIPDEAERTWMWHWLAHKARRPWIPMVAVIMVAEEFGSGRGTLFDILELRLRQGLRRSVLVRGIDGEGARGALQRPARRRPVRRRQRGGRRGRAPAKPAPDDLRRLEECVRTLADGAAALRAEEPACRRAAGSDERDHRDAAYRRGQAAVGRPALQRHHLRREDDGGADSGDPGLDGGPGEYRGAPRALLATPAAAIEDFDPFGTPPPFAGRLEMIGLGKTDVEDAYEAAMAALKGCSLFTRTQAVRLISYFVGDFNGGGGNQDRAKHTITKRAKRLRDRGEPYDRFWYRNKQDILYASTAGERLVAELWDEVQREYGVTDRGGIELLAQACGALDRAEALGEAIARDGCDRLRPRWPQEPSGGQGRARRPRLRGADAGATRPERRGRQARPRTAAERRPWLDAGEVGHERHSPRPACPPLRSADHARRAGGFPPHPVAGNAMLVQAARLGGRVLEARAVPRLR